LSKEKGPKGKQRSTKHYT